MRHREYSIFYSWQSDADKATNWDFIQSALEMAVAEIKARNGFDIPILDWGMERVAGSPEVATIMFEKINKAAIFVGDLSLVGDIKQPAGQPTKKTANPNVLMEMAYAGAKIGWQRVICVMNTQFGKAEKLPVDIRNRRFPIRYKMPPDDKKTVEKVKTGLAEDLRKAIDVVLYRDHQAVLEAGNLFDVSCIRVVGAYRVNPYFIAPPANQFTLGAPGGLDTPTINAAITRLLDLGLIYCDFDSRQNFYAYQWTFLGRMYIREHWPNEIPEWLAAIDRQAAAAESATSPGPGE